VVTALVGRSTGSAALPVKTDCGLFGQLPFAENQSARDGRPVMIPTAEVPVTNMYRTKSGRRAAAHLRRLRPASAAADVGRGDTRGTAGHQFDKVEMVKFYARDQRRRVRQAEDAEGRRLLEIPHRVVQMVTGDLSFQAAKKCDVEMWAPGCGEWLEVSSVSNFKDFQARRANIKFRRAKGAKPEFVHTLNGSGLGLPRTLIAVMENYQQKDGSIVVPGVLRPYMGGLEVIR
jgi:seryl-tRNA synthetase